MRMRRSVFDAAVQEHSRRVFTLAAYLLGDHGEAEDVTQEVLIRLWRRGDEVATERIGAWLLRVTRNACIDLIRRRKTIAPLEAVAARHHGEQEMVSPGPERLAQASQLGHRIIGALQSLAEPQRSIVILREVHGLPYQEISEVLRIPISTVRVSLHRGRRKLRQELEEVVDHVAVC